VLIVLSGILVPIGVVAAWADSTIYDSATFSRRAVQLLDSSSVRRELAERLTEQLARAGNEQAIAFRPAAILAVEAVVDTDTFRSIFRTAIRQTHESLVEGLGGAGGLDLSDSFALVSASLEAPSSGGSAKAAARDSDGAWPTSRGAPISSTSGRSVTPSSWPRSSGSSVASSSPGPPSLSASTGGARWPAWAGCSSSTGS
jgi:hypothetical protein